MQQFFADLSGSLINVIVYTAICVVVLVGLTKCVFPMRRLARLFRKGVRSLESMTNTEGIRPVWQDSLFLGRPMQKQWKRFLLNAEQLDRRGLPCDTEDYINDETVIKDYAHLQVAEIVPGLLTSLGILGTFIGLMRGVSGLDVTNADATMESISKMIGGMTFAYGTSIAGLACSLLFNIFFRVSQGETVSAMEDYHQAFRELVMPVPLESDVRQTCYMEDQALFLKQSADGLTTQLKNGISASINSAFTPIASQMNAFIMAETKGQLEGLGRIVTQFISQMDGAMGGQFRQLAQTFSAINQAQSVSYESINHAMTAADALMQNLDNMNQVSGSVIERFDSYIHSLQQSQQNNVLLTQDTTRVMSALHQTVQRQKENWDAMLKGQQDLSEQMQRYAAWSGRVLESVEQRGDTAAEQTHALANEMAASAKQLKSGYADFVDGINKGLAKTMSLFEENMRDVLASFSKGMQALGAGKEPDLKALSELQQAMADLSAQLKQGMPAEKENVHA